MAESSEGNSPAAGVGLLGRKSAPAAGNGGLGAGGLGLGGKVGGLADRKSAPASFERLPQPNGSKKEAEEAQVEMSKRDIEQLEAEEEKKEGGGVDKTTTGKEAKEPNQDDEEEEKKRKLEEEEKNTPNYNRGLAKPRL